MPVTYPTIKWREPFFAKFPGSKILSPCYLSTKAEYCVWKFIRRDEYRGYKLLEDGTVRRVCTSKYMHDAKRKCEEHARSEAGISSSLVVVKETTTKKWKPSPTKRIKDLMAMAAEHTAIIYSLPKETPCTA